jgi:hypothetical protein
MLAEHVESREHLSFWALSLFVLRWAAWKAFNLWFWFHGLTVPNPDQCMEPRVFLFANLEPLESFGISSNS